jgi:outer membrane protein assembly factor BamD (BamD/ComL family)
MTTRLSGLAALAAIAVPATTHAEIAAPPPLGQNPDPAAQATPAMQEFAAPPSKPASLSDKADFSSIPTPIEFDDLESEVEEDLGLVPDRAGEVASVKSMEIEIQQALELGDTALAEKLFDRLMRLGAPTSRKRDAILRMGRQLEEQQKQPAKAIVVYEQFIQQFPNDPEAPDILLRLGRTYRNTGAYTSALNKFYSVLYSSIQVKTGEDATDSSLRAKMEIAHTHFAAGEYKEAAELYSRVKLVKMSPEEASEVAFRLAYISFLAGQHAEALSKSEAFLDTYPASPLAPEAQYLKIQSLKKLGRHTEAMKETIELLQAGREFGKKKPAVWAYWQRKTGNEIANELYESGDAFGALTVYQKLAALNDAPDWRGPNHLPDRPLLRTPPPPRPRPRSLQIHHRQNSRHQPCPGRRRRGRKSRHHPRPRRVAARASRLARENREGHVPAHRQARSRAPTPLLRSKRLDTLAHPAGGEPNRTSSRRRPLINRPAQPVFSIGPI